MTEKSFKGIPASDGIAIGPVFCYIPAELTVPVRAAGSAEEELARFDAARERARVELQGLYDSIEKRAGKEEASIFVAHQEMLYDPALEGKIREFVEIGQTAEQALVNATDELADLLASTNDELFAARALDVKDVGRRVLRILLGLPDTALGAVSEPSIILAEDLTPSDTASLNPSLTLGFITAQGGLTSHSAILARTLGLPAIVGMGNGLLDHVSNGAFIVMDGRSGEMILEPNQETITRCKQIKSQRESQLQILKSAALKYARTAEGRRVEVAANVGEAGSARDAIEHGAEGIGLLRTEFLYLEDTQPPSEEKQFRIYREIFEVMSGRPVIVRTLDIGGDKPPSYLPFPDELNPFLGWRAIRISLDEPELFKTQIRAILRAATGHRARIMFPMVSDLDELRRARDVVEAVKRDLKSASVEFAADIPVGIMVETPAAAVLVDVLAEASDFFSLGTNDLTQYTLAVDRGNAKVANLFQPLHPAVLRLIRQTIEAGHDKGKWVGMCGELAGMTKAIPILLGFGLDEFSMNPRAIPEAKHLIGKLTDDKAREIADQAMSLGTTAEIEKYMKAVLAELD
ncbi:MAG: phosphoenolpyruvate-protein phosphotransferase [Anaerolineaceae bacterium]|nr:MAG: phosphoenolpyruvate-protein phosphotransferase [Anaerolineaceae bacterium]